MEVNREQLYGILREALRRALEGEGRPKVSQKEVAAGTGIGVNSISMFHCGKQGLGAASVLALCDYLGIDATTGSVIDSNQPTTKSRRYKIKVKKRTGHWGVTGGVVFMESPAYPLEFEVDEEEARLIWERREAGPYAGFAIALAEIQLAQTQLATMDVIAAAEAAAAAAVLMSAIQSQRIRKKAAEAARKR